MTNGHQKRSSTKGTSWTRSKVTKTGMGLRPDGISFRGEYTLYSDETSAVANYFEDKLRRRSTVFVGMGTLRNLRGSAKMAFSTPQEVGSRLGISFSVTRATFPTNDTNSPE